MMQVQDKLCSFNVIFYFEIILIIKSLSTVHACVRSVHAVRAVQKCAGLKGRAASCTSKSLQGGNELMEDP